MKSIVSLGIGLLFLSVPSLVCAQNKDRNTLVREDRVRVLNDGFWIYNDVEQGLAQAQASGKPLLIVFRCIPCEACAQLDEQVVENNPAVRKALSQFVCVRQVYTNGIDLSRFQFDYDQSWAAFFMNGDGTIYGRYGTRSHQTESAEDVSLDGFLDTMGEVLKLHQRFDQVKAALAGKSGTQAVVAVPEDFPSLKERYAKQLNYEGEVAKSCIHCHQIGDALHDWYRSAAKPIPAEVMYPYPHPKILGLTMDPLSAVRIAQVTPGSWGAEAGFQAGDELRELAGQPLVSMADVQWVLHNTAEQANLSAIVERQGNQEALTLRLPTGWRETGDISWRATSWPLRGKVLGGMRLRTLTPEESEQVGSNTGIGFFVHGVGQYGIHQAAKRAGVKPNDIVLSIAGMNQPMTESQLLVNLMRSTKPGDVIQIEVLRDGKPRTIELPIQE